MATTSDDLSLYLIAKLDPIKSQTEIQKQINALNKYFETIPLELKVEINPQSVEKLKKTLTELATLQSKIGSVGGSKGDLIAAKLETEAAKAQKIRNDDARAAEKAANVIAAAAQKKTDAEELAAKKVADALADEKKAREAASEAAINASEKRQAAAKKERDRAIALLDAADLKEERAMDREVRTEEKKNAAALKLFQERTAREKKLDDEKIANKEKAKKEADDKELAADNRLYNKQLYSFKSFIDKRQGAINKANADKLDKEKEDKDKAAKADAKQAVKDKAKAAADAERAYKQSFAGKFVNALDEVAVWTSVTSMVFGSIRALKDGFDQITQIDTAMTNLKKVTDETRASYESFSREANVMAHNLGSGTVEIIQATAEFARLGYSLEKSKGLANEAILYSNVGGMDVTKASETLISTVKGFGIEVDAQQNNVRHIVDVYNEIGNNFAITSGGIGEAASRSASSLREAGNSMEQSVAMITAANTVVQDPETVGTALKTVAMRLRGVDEAGDPVLGMTAKLEGNFTKIGLTMMKDNDTFKSTFEIMQDLAGVWGTLTDIQRADMLEQVAGKRQGNIVAGMLNNWRDAEKVVDSAMNSMGSAAKENATYMESIEAKQKQAANSVTGFWQALISDKSAKTALDTFTGLMQVVTKAVQTFGGFPSVLGAAAFAQFAFAAVTGKAATASVMQTGALGMLSGAFNTVKLAAMKAGGAMAIVEGLMAATVIGAVVMGITAVLGLMVKAASDAYNAHENLVKTLEEEVTAGAKTESSLGSLAQQYAELSTKVKQTTEDKARMVSIQEEMASQLPQLIKGYDAEGKAIYANAEEMRQYIQELKLANAETAHLLAMEHQNDYGEMAKKIAQVGPAADEGNAEIEKRTATIETLKKQVTEWKAQSNTFAGEMSVASSSSIMSQVHAEEQALNAARIKVAAARKTSSEELGHWRDDFSKQAQMGDALLKTPSRNVDVLRKLLIDNMIEMSNKSEGQLKTFSNQFHTAWANFAKEANNGTIKLDKLVEGEGLEKNLAALAVELTKLNMPGIDVKKVIDGLRDSMATASTKAYDYRNAMSTLISELDTSGSKIDNLAKAYRQLEQGQHLSLSEIDKLIKAHPQLIDSLEIQNGALGIQAGALKEVGILEGETMRQKVIAEQTKAKSAIDSAKIEIQAILARMGAEKSYQELLAHGSERLRERNAARLGEDATVNPWVRTENLGLDDFLSNLGVAERSLDRHAKTLEALDPNKLWQAAYNDSVDHNKDSKEKTGSGKVDQFAPNAYEHEMARIDAALSKLATEKQKYTETDKRFLEIQREEIALHREKQGQYSAEANEIRNSLIPALEQQMAQYGRTSKEYNDLLKQKDDLDKKAKYQLPTSWWSEESTISGIVDGKASKKDRLADIKQELDTNKAMWDEQINNSQARQAEMDKMSDGFRNELHTQNEIMRSRVEYETTVVKVLGEEAAILEQRLKTEEMTGSVLQAVTARLKDVQGLMAERNKSISTQNELIKKNGEAWWNSIREWEKAAKQVADKVVDAYKEVQKVIHDAAISEVELLKKAEEDRHNEAVANIDEESKRFEEAVNDKIKAIDKQYQNEQDNKNRAKEEEIRKKLVEEIDKFALDNSVEGRAKTEELRKKLKEQDDKMQDMRDKNTHDQRKENLQTELDTYKRAKESEKKTEDDRHKQELNHFEELKKQYDEIYDKAINNETKINELRKQVFDGNMNEVLKSINTYFGAFDTISDGTMQRIADRVRGTMDLTQRLKDLSESISGANGEAVLPAPPGTDNKNTQGKSGTPITENSGEDHGGWKRVQAYEQYIHNKVKAQEIYTATGSWASPNIKPLSDQNVKFRTDFGFQDISSDQALAEWDKIKEGGNDRYVKNKVRWWTINSQFGSMNNPEQVKLAEDNARLRGLFGFADLTQDDLKVKGLLPFDTTARDQALRKMVQNKLLWKKDRAKLDTTQDATEREKLQTEMATVGDENSTIRGTHGFHDYTESELRRLEVPGFSVGGYTGKWAGAGGRIIAVHPEEYVLNRDDTKNILKSANVMRDLLQSPSRLSKTDNTAPAGVTIGQISLTIERLSGDEQGGKTVFKTLVDELKRTKGVKL